MQYVSAAAAAAGHTTSVHHLHGKADWSTFFASVATEKPDAVGFSVLAYNADCALELSRTVKRTSPETVIIWGGYHASSVPEVVRDPSVDFAVIGEGERPFVALLSALAEGGDVASIPGLAYKRDGTVAVTPAARPVEDLDSLPWPSRIGPYKTFTLVHPSPKTQRGLMEVMYSRGCPHRCAYCNSPVVSGNRVRWRSAARVVDEVQHLQNAYGTDVIYFTDLTFNENKARVLALCRELTDRRVRVSWICGCRTDCMSPELLDAMRKAGCSRIHYGIESLDVCELARMNRPDGLERSKEVFRYTHESGIITRGYIMLGFPTQTREDIERMAPVLRTFAVDDLRISLLTPFPGTELFDEYKRSGLLLTEDFSQYTTDEPVVRMAHVLPEELTELRAWLFRSYYGSREYSDRTRQKLTAFPHLRQSFKEFFEFLHSSGVPT